METSQSPRTVLNAAYRLALRVFPAYAREFSRHDFTLPQLFACLVLREFYGLSYRRTEKLLCDSPPWLADIGLCVVPDHNTLWRAFGLILKTRRINRLLDLQVKHFTQARLLHLSQKPLTLDSTCFEQRRRSAHYDRRCRQMRHKGTSKTRNSPGKPGKWGLHAVGASWRCPSCRWRWPPVAT